MGGYRCFPDIGSLVMPLLRCSAFCVLLDVVFARQPVCSMIMSVNVDTQKQSLEEYYIQGNASGQNWLTTAVVTETTTV